jgi:hypothetical protein
VPRMYKSTATRLVAVTYGTRAMYRIINRNQESMSNNASTVPVGDLGPVLGLSVEPKVDFVTKEHKRTKDGKHLLWTVVAFIVGRQVSVKVTVPADQPPAIHPGQPVQFQGLEAGAYVSGTNAVFYWAADAITVAAPRG